MSKETEFDFSKIDSSEPMFNSALSKLREDVLAFNDAVQESNLSEQELSDACLGAINEFDDRWPYMDKPIILSGNISLSHIDDKNGSITFFNDEQIYVDDKDVVSYGFHLQETEKGVELGYLFSYEIEEIEMSDDSIAMQKLMYGWARVDQVSLLEIGLSSAQACENLEREAPDLLRLLDDALLNATSIADAIESIGKFRLDVDLPLNHRRPFEWKKMSLKRKKRYMNSIFDELKDTIELYIASKLDMYEPMPYTVVHSGFLVTSCGQRYGSNAEFLMIPEDIILVPEYRYLGNGKADIVEDVYVPALQGQVSFPDKNHHSGYTLYAEAVVLMNEGFCIESNLRQNVDDSYDGKIV